jgi:hypothetical protein
MNRTLRTIIHGESQADITKTTVASIIIPAVLGSIAFGIVMSLTLGAVLLVAIPGMYGLTGISTTLAVLVGWVIHISHGTVLGVVFGVVVTLVPACGKHLKLGLAAGIVYGVFLWLVLATFVMPIWVGAATGMSPPVPDIQPWSLVGHILYGAFIGLLIPLYRRY